MRSRGETSLDDAHGEIVHERRLNGAVIEKCAAFAAEHGFAPVAYDRDRLYTSMITPRTEEAVNRLFLFAATAGTRPHAAGLLGPSITSGQGEVPSEGPAEDV